jgi:hypothetical protein
MIRNKIILVELPQYHISLRPVALSGFLTGLNHEGAFNTPTSNAASSIFSESGVVLKKVLDAVFIP